MSKSFLRSANISKIDIVSQCGAIVVARKEPFAPWDGYWNGFSNVARETRESLPLQRSKYILLRYALMNYSGPHRETVAALSYFVAFSHRPVRCKLQCFSANRIIPESSWRSLNIMTELFRACLVKIFADIDIIERKLHKITETSQIRLV